MIDYKKILSGGDIRSIGKSNYVVQKVKRQSEFDEVFKCIDSDDRVVAMRALDAIEKITKLNSCFLIKHKKKILQYFLKNGTKEFKWHIVLIISRLELTSKEQIKVRNVLRQSAFDKTNSRIVRVNSLQGLFEMSLKTEFIKEFLQIITQLEKENIPSINSRIRILKKSIDSNNILK